MSEMIERVAMALASTGYGRAYKADPNFMKLHMPGGISEYATTRWELYVPEARAAIEAMKMVDAQEGVPGGTAFEDTFFGDQDTVFHATRDAWNATIDAVLK